MSRTKGQKQELELGSPMRGGMEGYTQTRFISFQQMGQIIQTLTTWEDPRIYAMTLHDIAGITDDDKRQLAFEILEKKITKANESKSLTPMEKAKNIYKCCMELQGDITAWYDEFTGVTHKLVIGVVEPPPDEEEVNDDAERVEGAAESPVGCEV